MIRHSFGASKPRRLRWVLLAVLLATLASVASADGVAYQATSDYALKLGDELVAEAEVFYSARHVSYLVISRHLERPLLARIPEKEVVEVSADSVSLDALQGEAWLSPSEERRLIGFERRLKEIRFELQGEPAALVPAPPVLGWRSPDSLRAKSHVMRSGFARADKTSLARKSLPLAPDRELVVEVFFGSWDEYSQLVMPKIMQLEEDLAGNPVQFRYYGLPRRIADDPIGVEHAIHGVPTVVVSENETELGRLVGRPLMQPGASLEQLLTGGVE
ncbi:MAG: thioredoxin family protein [Acidobacteriota bacterium]